MNAALAISGDQAYVGSRTDGSEGHRRPGVLILNIADPGIPWIVGEIGPPNQGNLGETSRELRVWPEQGLLIVLNFQCSPDLHACARARVTSTIRFYDIQGERAVSPTLVATYRPSREPHEFFLWLDPSDKARALLFMSTPGQEKGSLIVTDISRAREQKFEEIASWATSFPDRGPDDNLHSLGVSADGRRAYLAHLTAGFLILDTAEVAEGVASPKIRAVTLLRSRPQWPGRGPHSSVKVPGGPLALTTDEVYGGRGPDDGCPWGWARLIDTADESAPRVLSQYRLMPYNTSDYCRRVSRERDRRSSFSSHNPTVTPKLAFVTWHSGGLQAISIADPTRPTQAAQFLPDPLHSVTTEDPALSSGPDKVVMWSYPIIQRGLIYVVDVRNGLYVLDYDGPYEEEVTSIDFLEGNSNLGAAAMLGN